jgi:hypothetical protein
LPILRLTGKLSYADYDWKQPNDAYGRCYLGEEIKLRSGWTLQSVYGFAWDEGVPDIHDPAIRITAAAEWQ